MKSKNQIYADLVFPKVMDIAEQQRRNGENDLRQRKYRSLCKRAGSLVRSSGLMQTVAFFIAKAQKEKEKHHEDLLHHVEAVLRELEFLEKDKSLFEKLRKADLPLYMHLTREILHLFNWHKRFADILISGTADHDEEGADD